jgi:hypothetical protein
MKYLMFTSVNTSKINRNREAFCFAVLSSVKILILYEVICGIINSMQFGAYKIKIRISHLLDVYIEPVKRNVIKRFENEKTDRRAVKQFLGLQHVL